MLTVRVRAPRWAVISGGLAGAAGVGIIAGVLAASLSGAASALVGLVSLPATLLLSFWIAPFLMRVAARRG